MHWYRMVQNLSKLYYISESSLVFDILNYEKILLLSLGIMDKKGENKIHFFGVNISFKWQYLSALSRIF